MTPPAIRVPLSGTLIAAIHRSGVTVGRRPRHGAARTRRPVGAATNAPATRSAPHRAAVLAELSRDLRFPVATVVGSDLFDTVMHTRDIATAPGQAHRRSGRTDLGDTDRGAAGPGRTGETLPDHGAQACAATWNRRRERHPRRVGPAMNAAAGSDRAHRQAATVADGPMFPTAIDPVAVIRPLGRGEAAPLEEVMAGLSARSRYLRFHSPIAVLTPAMRRVLLDVDGRDHVAVAAETAAAGPGARVRAVGIARLIRDPHAPGEAEVAIAVVDAWHRCGVGRGLLEALTEQAWEIGVTRLHARVLSDNLAALGLIRAVFPVLTARRDADVIHLICILDGVEEWEITMADILADLTG